MTLLHTINMGSTDFGILNTTVMGVCATPAGSEVKACTFADSFELKAGAVITIKFTYANTYGDGSTTYPKLSVNGTTGAIRNATGAYASNGAWQAQSLIPFIFDGTDFTLVTGTVTDTISADNAYPVSSRGVAGAISSIISVAKSCKVLNLSELGITGNHMYSYDEFSAALCDYIGQNEGMVAMSFNNDTGYTVSVSFGSRSWTLNDLIYIGKISKTSHSSGGIVMFPSTVDIYRVYYKAQSEAYDINEVAFKY